MILIVGLGNPGEKFSQTRHNTGFLFLEYLQRRLGTSEFKSEKKFLGEISILTLRQALQPVPLEYKGKKFDGGLMLLRPQTFMNTSGDSVARVLKFYKNKFKKLVLCYDDLDIEFGKFKIEDKGPRVHNGVNSVMSSVLQNFTHVRIGIMGEDYYKVKRAGKSMADDYILKPFNKDEKKRMEPLFERVWERLEKVII